MKNFTYFFYISIFMTMAFGKSNISVGMEAPEFELPDQDSTLHKLIDYRGTTVVLYFFPMADTPG
jgi:peroxiredoxin